MEDEQKGLNVNVDDFHAVTFAELGAQDQQRVFADALEGKETLSGFFRYKDRIYSIYRLVSAIIDAREAGK